MSSDESFYLRNTIGRMHDRLSRMDTDLKARYTRLLREIPKLACDLKVLYDKGKDPSDLEELFEGKKEELTKLSRQIYSEKVNDAILLVVSAPSGAGKTTVCRKLLSMVSGLHFSVSFTTRSPRRGEVDGRDYYFISKEEFNHRIAAGEFAEWAENYGNMYGTSLEEIGQSLAQNKDVLLDIDPRGAHAIKTNYPNGVFVFILPPSLDILKQRLIGRGSERSDVINMRFEKAVDEIKEALWYDYIIFNDNVENSVDILRSIYIAEKNTRLRAEDKIQTLRRRR